MTTASSPKKISPASGVSRPATMRSVVVLPQPLGPSKCKNLAVQHIDERSLTAGFVLPG